MGTEPIIKNSPHWNSKEMHRLFKQLEGYNKEATDNFFNALNSFVRTDQFFQKTKGYGRKATEQQKILDNLLEKCDELLPMLQSLNPKQPNLFESNYDRPTKLLIKRSLYCLMQEISPSYFKPISKNPVDVNDYKSIIPPRRLMPSFEEHMVKSYDIADPVDSDLRGLDPALISKFSSYPNDLIDSMSEFRNAVKRAASSAKVPPGNNRNRDPLRMVKMKFAKCFLKSYLECFKEYPLNGFKVPVYTAFNNFLLAGGFDDTDHKSILDKAIKLECKSS